MREFKLYNLLNPAKTENKKRNYESRKVRLIKMKNNKNILGRYKLNCDQQLKILEAQVKFPIHTI